MFLLRAIKTTVGLKVLMGLTGALMMTWVTVHMLGNLQIFFSYSGINHYGQLLRTLPEALWAERFVMLGIVIVHFYSALELSARNRAARPIDYTEIQFIGASFASKTMLVSGLVVGSFIIFHLLHFTGAVFNPEYNTFHDPTTPEWHDVHRMVVSAFQQWPIALTYLVGVLLAAIHLSHGAQSWFQSLGCSNEAWSPLQERFAWAISAVLFLGFASVPLAVWSGLLK